MSFELEPDDFCPLRKPEASCPSCGSESRAECYYVPGMTGMPVTCGSDWHDDDARGPGDHPVLPDPAPKEGRPMDELASQLRESRLAGRIDQLIGWAKCGQRPSYPAKPDVYILEAEKTDALRNDIIDVIVAELGGVAANSAEQPEDQQ